jgi:hypothetical protein
MSLNDLVGGDVDGLDNLADGSCLNELACFDCGFYFKALAVHDCVNFFSFGDGLANCGEVLEGGDAWLITQEVFAVFHGADADAGALVGDLRAENELRGGIVDDLILRGDDLDVGVAFFEGGQFVFLATPRSDQGSPATLHGPDHAVDVIVAHAADGEFDRVLRLGGSVLTRLGHFMGDVL